MSFSERMKLVPIKQIQTNDMDSVLKHRIINLIEDTFNDTLFANACKPVPVTTFV